MNWLQLVNMLRQECGASGADLTQVANSTLLTREGRRFRDWTNASWRKLQRLRPDWEWMRQSVTFSTVAQQAFYTPTQAGITSFRNWKRDSFRCSTPAANYGDEQILLYLDYNRYRNLYQYAQTRFTYTRPTIITIDPAKKLGLGAIPDAVYTINGEYWRAVTDFAADTDTPTGLPDDFHEIIVWLAMLEYGGFEAASEVYVRARENYVRLLSELVPDQTPDIMFGPAMA